VIECIEEGLRAAPLKIWRGYNSEAKGWCQGFARQTNCRIGKRK